jgi:FlaA1/EpsC-like NDP-sugar epimerase
MTSMHLTSISSSARNLISSAKNLPSSAKNLPSSAKNLNFSMIIQLLLFLSNLFVIIFLYLPISDYTMKRGLSITIISLLTISIVMLVVMFCVNYKNNKAIKFSQIIQIFQFFLNLLMLIMFSVIYNSQTKSDTKTNLKRQRNYYITTYVFALLSIISNTFGLYISFYTVKLCLLQSKTPPVV